MRNRGIATVLAATFLLSANASEENAGEGAENSNRFRDLFPAWVKCVAIVSPASPGQTGEVDLGIALLKQAGIQVVVMPHAREHENSGYFTIEAEKRAADLENAWLDPRVDLILCTRGGIGSEDLADKLNWKKLARRKDMPVVGFSNITSLHCAMLKTGVGHPFSGPSLTALLGCDETSLKHFRRTLDGDDLAPVQLRVLRGGKASGLTAGGHLMLLETMSRGDYAPDYAGKVVFIECPGRQPSAVENALNEMRGRGCFRKCAGIVFGHFVNCGPSGEVEEVLLRFSGTVACPVFSGFPYGHSGSNRMLDFRRKVSVGEDGMLVFEKPQKKYIQIFQSSTGVDK